LASFAVPVLRLDRVEPHPFADRLDLAVIGGYNAIIGKDQFKAGDLVVYIPEDSVLPEDLIDKLNVRAYLSGAGKNRVKAMKLRKVLSQGIVCSLDAAGLSALTAANDDVSQMLGVVKYEPAVPAHLGGSLTAGGARDGLIYLDPRPAKYDIENLKKFPGTFADDEVVQVTEKLHGTYMQIGWDLSITPTDTLFGDGRVWINSKGLGAKGYVFRNPDATYPVSLRNRIKNWIRRLLGKKTDRPVISVPDNVYVRTAVDTDMIQKLMDYVLSNAPDEQIGRLVLMGELFGDVQDLKYGMKQGEVLFRLFDIQIFDTNGRGGYLDAQKLSDAAVTLNIPTVPVLALAPWKDVQPLLANGTSMFGDRNHMREGVIIRSAVEREVFGLGRAQLKYVTEQYLLRKGETTELS